MQAAVQNAQAVQLGDGRVLAVGWNRNGDQDGGRALGSGHEPLAQDGEPPTRNRRATCSWRSMMAVRSVAGGINDDSESFSSTYAFNPATEHWSKVGLMHTARTDPVAAVLSDGRVIVAGGRYSTGPNDYGTTDVVLAVFHDDRFSPSGHGSPVLADADPGPTGRALATAEIFDPRTCTRSQTGSMRYARVAGWCLQRSRRRTRRWTSPRVRDRYESRCSAEDAGATAEIYDPGKLVTSAPPHHFRRWTHRRSTRSGSHRRMCRRTCTTKACSSCRRGLVLPIGTPGLRDPRPEGPQRQLSVSPAGVDTGPGGGWLFVREYDEEGDVLRVFGDRHPTGFAVALGDGRVIVARWRWIASSGAIGPRTEGPGQPCHACSPRAPRPKLLPCEMGRSWSWGRRSWTESTPSTPSDSCRLR